MKSMPQNFLFANKTSEKRLTCVFLSTLAKNLKINPSSAIAYKHRGRENNEPNRDVVIPQKAPIVTTYLTQTRSISLNASGRAAVVTTWVYGTTNVNAALTSTYTVPERPNDPSVSMHTVHVNMLHLTQTNNNHRKHSCDRY